nr:hypothetical protein [Staphylococcus lugdunensis]
MIKHSILWSKSVIPLYFFVAFLTFLLFHFYLKSDNISIYIIIFTLVGFGITSMIYNTKYI